MDNKYVETAVRLFSEGSACSQAVLAALGPLAGLDSGLAHRMGAGLGAGVGRKQYLCGAVNAGAMLISLKYGITDPANTIAKERASGAVRDFITAMESAFGSSNCRDILGVSIETMEERQEAQRRGLFDSICSNCVRTVSEYLVRELDTNA